MRLRQLVLGLSGASPIPMTDKTASPRSREFAVLVPILEHEGNECVLLTKRPDTLARYAGQVCLPGGERDPVDATLEDTALRETWEEVGIPRDRVTLLRELGWHRTSVDHRVKPFVGRIAAPYELRPDPREVERVLFVPTALITPDLFRVRGAWVGPDGREHTVHTFPWDGYEIWGLTARILQEAFLGG